MARDRNPEPVTIELSYSPDDIAGLQVDFPDYAISSETVRDQDRYVARSQHPGLNPHTVITADAVELRTLLGCAPAPSPPAGDPPCWMPNIARMYDRWLGGKDHLAADRHARALLANGPGVSVIDADMRQPAALLARAEMDGLIDLGQPVCLILASVLHFVSADEADAIVAALVAAVALGSYLIVSAGTSTGTDPVLIDRLRAAYTGTTVVTGRTEAEIGAYFTAVDLVPPGLTDVGLWRPDHWGYQPTPGARIVGAVGRKPATPAADH